MRIYIYGYLDDSSVAEYDLDVVQGDTPRVDVTIYDRRNPLDGSDPALYDVSSYDTLTFVCNEQVVAVGAANKAMLTLPSTMTEEVSDGLDWVLTITGPGGIRDSVARGRMVVTNNPALEPTRNPEDYPPVVLPSDVYQDLIGQLNPAGTWAPTTGYDRMELVSSEGSTYLVTEQHTSAATIAEDVTAGRLQLFAAVGSDGADGVGGSGDPMSMPWGPNWLRHTRTWSSVTPGDISTAFGSGWAVTLTGLTGTVDVIPASSLSGGLAPANGLELWSAGTPSWSALRMTVSVNSGSVVNWYLPADNIADHRPSERTDAIPLKMHASAFWHVVSVSGFSGGGYVRMMDHLRAGGTTALYDLHTLPVGQWVARYDTMQGVQDLPPRIRWTGVGDIDIILALPRIGDGDPGQPIHTGDD